MGDETSRGGVGPPRGRPAGLMRRLFDRTTRVFLVLALLATILVLWREGADAVVAAGERAAGIFVKVLPQLAAGLTIGAFAQILAPREAIAARLEAAPALAGPAVAMVAGMLTPSGPFVSFPLALAIWKAGADVGVIVAYVTGWGLLGIERALVWELPLMGPEFTALRYCCCLPGPILAGLLARAIAARTGLGRRDDAA